MTDPAPRSDHPKNVAIVGGGPIGIEAALYAEALGHDVLVLERGQVGEHVRRWGFVKLFSPWSMNVSSLGLAALRQRGIEPPSPTDCPSGHDFVDSYLAPLAEHLGERTRTRCEVVGIARQGLLKHEAIETAGSTERRGRTFRLLVRQHDSQSYREEAYFADVVIDASGVFATPGALGDGGVPCPGEATCRERIVYHPPDVLGADRSDYASRTTLLVGAGHSASTALRQLLELAKSEASTRVIWARRDLRSEPALRVENDPLSERDALCVFANAVDDSPPDGCCVLRGVSVLSVAPAAEELLVDVIGTEDDKVESLCVDRIVALVGYRPDTSIHRELQVHHCYASEGPMKLAAALLGAESDGDNDCLAQIGFGPESLAQPEPDFFIVGQKSYGRRNDFLLRIGREQVRDVFRLIEKDGSLDLYDEAAKARR
jgi:thioredoxin reductase